MHPFKSLWFNRLVFYSALFAGCLLAFAPANAGLHPYANDKLLHAVGFFVMAILSHLAHPKASPWCLVVALSLFGIGIEIVQGFLPYRDFSFLDWFADILGLLLYFFGLIRIISYYSLRRKSVLG